MNKKEIRNFVLWTTKVHPIPTANWARKVLLPIMFKTGFSVEEILLLECMNKYGKCPHTK